MFGKKIILAGLATAAMVFGGSKIAKADSVTYFISGGKVMDVLVSTRNDQTLGMCRLTNTQKHLRGYQVLHHDDLSTDEALRRGKAALETREVPQGQPKPQ